MYPPLFRAIRLIIQNFFKSLSTAYNEGNLYFISSLKDRETDFFDEEMPETETRNNYGQMCGGAHTFWSTCPVEYVFSPGKELLI